MANYRTIYVIISCSTVQGDDFLSQAFTDLIEAQKQLAHFRETFKGHFTFRLEVCTLMTGENDY